MEFGSLFVVFIVAGLGLWIWALVDAIGVPNDSDYQSGTKLVWVLVIVLAGFIGAIVYFAVGRPDKGQRSSARPPVAQPPSGSMPPPPPIG